MPVALKAQRQVLPVEFANVQAPNPLAFVATVPRDATNQLVDDVRAHGWMSGVSQFLRKKLEVQGRACPQLKVRGQFPKLVDQVLFQAVRLEQTFLRRVLHAEMHEDSDRGIVRRDAKRLKIIQRLAHLTGRKTRDATELIRRDPLVRRRIDQAPNQGTKPEPIALRHICLGDYAVRFGEGPDAKRRRIHANAVFFSSQQHGFFQPRHGCLHPCVIGCGVTLEIEVLLLTHDLAGCRDNLALLLRSPVETAQGLEDCTDLPALKPRARREAELPLDVVTAEEENASGMIAITSGPSRLLQVVLQGTRDVGMDHKPDIRLVDPHAKGIRGGDHAQFASSKRILHVPFLFGAETGVIVGRGETAFLQEGRHALSCRPRRAIDDST